MAVTLKGITEDNFIDAFNLKLKKDQEEFVSRLEFMRMTGWSDI